MLMQPKLFAVQDVKKVYLNQAIDAALENNIDFQAAKLERNIAKNNIKTANRLQNPSFDAFYFLGAAGNSEPKQLGVSENIEIAKRKARKNLAESNLKLVEKNIDYTIFDLKMDVREAYINLVEAKSILDTLEQQEELQEELLKIAKVRVKNHNAPDIDVIQAEIALNQMITQVNSARVNVKKALSDFNKVINNPENIVYDSMDNIFSEENNFQEMMTPPPNFDFPSFDEIVQNAIRNRYDIQIKENNMHRKNILLELSKQTADVEKRKFLLQEVQEVNIELERLDKKIISYYDDVDKMTTSIKDFSLELNSTIKVLFDISLYLIKEKETQFELEK